MTYTEAMAAIDGHRRYWYYDFHGSDREPNESRRRQVQAEAIELAKTWVKPEMPPLTTQAGNLAGAIGRTIKAAVTGQPVRVSPEERDRRWGLCMTCENLVNDKCKLCGCHFRAKIELATERCPLDPPRWDRVENVSATT
jgi:hypothetical protein